MLFYFPFQTPLVSVFDQSTATVHFVSDKRFDVWEDIYSTEYPPADLSLSSSAKLHFHLFAIPDLGLEMECTEIMLPVPEASLPAIEICSETSAAGMIISASDTL